MVLSLTGHFIEVGSSPRFANLVTGNNASEPSPLSSPPASSSSSAAATTLSTPRDAPPATMPIVSGSLASLSDKSTPVSQGTDGISVRLSSSQEGKIHQNEPLAQLQSDNPPPQPTSSKHLGNSTKHSSTNQLIATTDSNPLGQSHLVTTSQRNKRNLVQEINPDCEFTVSKKPVIFGLRCDAAPVSEDGAIILKASEPTALYLIGRNLAGDLKVGLTPHDGNPQDDCTHTDRVRNFPVQNISSNVAIVIVEVPAPTNSIPYYFCLRESNDSSAWFHQGSSPWLKIYVKSEFLPLYMKLITIACLLGLSGLFSGLNLGLMALDKNELQVIMKCGSADEKRYARAIEPVRRRGNYLLCSILFSNTLVNSTISVFLEDLSDGLVAIITSTILIVMFGEILPQAFCSRHGLAVGAKTIGMTYLCMILTWPLSYPVSYCLDWVLGDEIGHAYDRERLMEFIQVTRDINNLEADEVNIISGALKIKRIRISEVMTRIEDVYMLDETAVLDFDTIQAIVEKGYSRIPVHEAGNRRNIVAVLFAKDLALVDPDDKTPVQTMISFYNHPRMFVYEDTTLDTALNEFKTGKSHMAIVQRLIDDGDRDPYYEIIGIVTLEDVIEEIMQMEINDETDTLTDNRRKRRRKEAQVRKDFSQFTNLGTGDSSFNVVTPQLCLAAYQYLATTVEPFSPKYLSDSILRRLLSQKIFYKVKLEDDKRSKRLYTAGEAADYFIMILEGRVHVLCGKENLIFEGGPFSFFGKAALTSDSQTTSDNLALGSPAAIESMPPQTSASRRGSSAVKPAMLLSRRDSSVSKVLQPQRVADQQQTTEFSEQLNVSTANLSPSSTMKVVESIEKLSSYFIPDYTVDIITNTSYLKVTRKDYLTALKATLVESGNSTANRGETGSQGEPASTRGDYATELPSGADEPQEETRLTIEPPSIEEQESD